MTDEPRKAPAAQVPQAAIEEVLDLAVRRVKDNLDKKAAPATVDSGAGARITQRYVRAARVTGKAEGAGVRVTVTVTPL